MAKQIFSFTQLCQEDQVALLKGGCMEMMFLRSVINFDPEKNGWQASIDNKNCYEDKPTLLKDTWKFFSASPKYGCLERSLTAWCQPL